MIDKLKQSWAPILLAFVLPTAIVGAAMVQIGRRDAMESANRGPLITLYGQASLQVSLQNREGRPITDRSVVFTQRFAGSAQEMSGEPVILRTVTDRRGVASVDVTKKGDVLITVEGTDLKEGLLQLEQSTRDEFRITLVVDTDAAP